MKKNQDFLRSIIVPVVIFFIWLVYMERTNQWCLFIDNWFMSVTMVFGSFIAGASSEGGGAVAFPVMTLLYDITPANARNFSLAIQSIGMTTASYIIIINRYPVEWRYLLPVSLGGLFGIVLGTEFLVPVLSPPFVKMLFVTFWLSFGMVLFYINQIYKRKVIEKLPLLSIKENIIFVVMGVLGGSLTALLGSGIDIFSFSFVTMRYHLSEKIATPTSVVIMAINSLAGFIYHDAVIGDFGPEEYNYWLVCIPVVILGAPLGARFINTRTRKFVAVFLYVIILAQFLGAWFIIKPTGELLLFTFFVFVLGLIFFFGFSGLFKNKSTV